MNFKHTLKAWYKNTTFRLHGNGFIIRQFKFISENAKCKTILNLIVIDQLSNSINCSPSGLLLGKMNFTYFLPLNCKK